MTVDNQISLSIITPVLNGEKTIANLYSRIKETLALSGIRFELIFVDDGSVDSSRDIIKKLHFDNASIVKYVFLPYNLGQHFATLCGLSFAKGETIVTIDDDLQYAPEEIPKLLNKFRISKIPLVYGYANKKRGIKGFRKVASHSLTSISHYLKISNSKASSYRVMDRATASKILCRTTQFVNIEQIVRLLNIQNCSVDVRHSSSSIGKSRYSNLMLITFVCKTIIAYTKWWPLILVFPWSIGLLFVVLFKLELNLFFVLSFMFIGVFVVLLFFFKRSLKKEMTISSVFDKELSNDF